MPYEIIVRFCVTDDAMLTDLEAIGYTGDMLEASKEQLAVAFRTSLQCAADNGDLPDSMFAVDVASITNCDSEEWAAQYLDADPKKLVADVLRMLEAGSYHSSYESQMIDKLRAARDILERHSK